MSQPIIRSLDVDTFEAWIARGGQHISAARQPAEIFHLINSFFRVLVLGFGTEDGGFAWQIDSPCFVLPMPNKDEFRIPRVLA